MTKPGRGNQQEDKRDFSGMGAKVLRVLLVVLAAVQLGQAADSFTSYGHDQSELAAWHAAAQTEQPHRFRYERVCPVPRRGRFANPVPRGCRERQPGPGARE